MRRTGFVILSCLILGFTQMPTQAASQVTALKVRHKTFDPDSRELGYELFNESGRTITAWRLGLARGDSQGNGQRSTLDQDFFERDAVTGLGLKRGPIRPGGSMAARWLLDSGLENSAREALSLRVIAVVFDDLTWQGEPGAVSILLEARSARVQEVGRLVADLERAERSSLAGAAWSAVLSEEAAWLKAQAGNEDELAPGAPREVAAVVSATRKELAKWLEDAGREVSLSPDPGATFEVLTGSLRDRYERGLRSTRARGTQEETNLDGKVGER